MIPYGWHVWRGETSRRYRFKITKTLEALPDAGGIYVMVRRTCFFFLSPVYIGKASNLQGRLTDHERWPDARKKGASERHYLCIRSESKRQKIEEDLIRQYKPKLNDMLVPRNSEDAPRHKKLSRGWMSAKQYYSLNDRPSGSNSTPKRERIDNRRKHGKRKKAA
ncbi:MAG: GIY-YIG nuclease family protein [Henriciella sp.]|nr:GIY-YIG nuclease family protein [Henriciella sp.]